MTPTIAAGSILLVAVLAILALAEIIRWMRRCNAEAETLIAKSAVRYWDDLVDKEIKR
ncbi:MAG: hypothetical protein ACYCSP_06070 [Acidobacteriaceae bacterium]